MMHSVYRDCLFYSLSITFDKINSSYLCIYIHKGASACAVCTYAFIDASICECENLLLMTILKYCL